MYTPWVNLLLASGAAHSTTAVDKALNSTIHAVSASVQTFHTTSQTVSQWGLLRKDLAGTMRDILRPIYDWCIDDTLVPSSVPTSPFAVPTPPPFAFWNAEVRLSSAPSPSSIPESLPTSSAVPLPKRIPSPTPASRPQPNVVISGWGRWRIASPTATSAPPNSPANTYTPTSTHDPRLGPVAKPHAASSQFSSSFHTSNGFIGPRLPTSPIGSFNGTELPVPNYACSPDHRPPKPRYIWTRRPKCPFDSGDLPEYIVCPMPIGLSEYKSIFLDPPGDPRDPIIDLGPALDTIPLSFESIVVPNCWSLPPLQRATSLRDSIWFKVGGAALTLVFIYVLYLGLPAVTGYNAANVNTNEPIEAVPPRPPRRRRAAAQIIEPEVNAIDVDASRFSYFDTIKGKVNGFFSEIIRFVICSCSFVAKTITSCLIEITRPVLEPWNLLARMIKSFFAGVISMNNFLWRCARKAIHWFFAATSRVILGTYAIARNVVKGSFKMVKDVFTYMAVLRFPQRQVTEQPTPTSSILQSPSPSASPSPAFPPGLGSFDPRIQRTPATNSANAQTTEQPEPGPSTFRSSNGLRSLPPGMADAIRAGNAPSLVRRAGKRRVNKARPLTSASASGS